MLFTDGYDGITDYLAEGLDIRLNRPVTAIRYSDRQVEVDAGKPLLPTGCW
ncbi:FAD-dependent oxidoreductase [Aliamphritea spongicola]|nr:FAD-dependent oxidoreductase [Aliamphritea spongicola]